jgi:hypothetical protein
MNFDGLTLNVNAGATTESLVGSYNIKLVLTDSENGTFTTSLTFNLKSVLTLNTTSNSTAIVTIANKNVSEAE